MGHNSGFVIDKLQSKNIDDWTFLRPFILGFFHQGHSVFVFFGGCQITIRLSRF